MEIMEKEEKNRLGIVQGSMHFGSRSMYGSALAWNEEGRLSIMTRDGLVIVTPRHEGGRYGKKLRKKWGCHWMDWFGKTGLKQPVKKEALTSSFTATSSSLYLNSILGSVKDRMDGGIRMGLDWRVRDAMVAKEVYRAIEWSPMGCTMHGSCLVSVLMTDHRVIIGKTEFDPATSEWHMLSDISTKLLEYYQSVQWEEKSLDKQLDNINSESLQRSASMSEGLNEETVKEVEVTEVNRIPSEQYKYRLDKLDVQCMCWSTIITLEDLSFVVLALGNKAGDITFWSLNVSRKEKILERNGEFFRFCGSFNARMEGQSMSWVTRMAWNSIRDANNNEISHLAVAMSDGSVRVWHLNYDIDSSMAKIVFDKNKISFMKEICSADGRYISVMRWCHATMHEKSPRARLAIGKSSMVSIAELIEKDAVITANYPFYPTTSFVSELLWRNEGEQLLVTTMDGKIFVLQCEIQSTRNSKELSINFDRSKTNFLLTSLAKNASQERSSMLLDSTETNVEQFKDKRIAGAALSQNGLFLALLYWNEGVEDESFRNIADHLLLDFVLLEDPKDGLIWKKLTQQTKIFIENRCSSYNPDFTVIDPPLGAWLWDIIEFMSYGDFFEDESSFYNYYLQSLIMIFNDYPKINSENLQRYAEKRRGDRNELVRKVKSALYAEEAILALKMLNFINLNLRFLVSSDEQEFFERSLEINQFELQKYLIECLLRFVAWRIANEKEFVSSLTESEMISCIIYCDWILQHQSKAKELNELARLIYTSFSARPYNFSKEIRLLDQQNSIMSSNELEKALQEIDFKREKCPACEKEIPFEDVNKATCPQLHVWERCSVTLLLNASPFVRTCTHCQRKASCKYHPRAPETSLRCGTLFSLLLEEIATRCLYCEGSFCNYF